MYNMLREAIMNNILAIVASIATIIGVPLAIIAIVVTMRDRQRRALSYAYDEILAPVEIKSGLVTSDIQILFKGKPVENIFVIRVGIKNTGGSASSIKRSELIEPIEFVFSSGTRILLEPQAIKLTPENIKVEYSLLTGQPDEGPRGATMTFDILNASWEIITEFVCTGDKNYPWVVGKVEGINKLENYFVGKTFDKVYASLMLKFIFVSFLFGYGVVTTSFILRLYFPGQEFWIQFIASLIAITFFFGAGIFTFIHYIRSTEPN
jgi:hypothetical protein